MKTENPPGRFCRMMAELEEGANPDSEAAHDWLKRAALADPDPAWICGHCGNVVAEWEPVCGRCEEFDSLSWDTPPRVTRLERPPKAVADAAEAPPNPGAAPLEPDANS